MKTFNIDDAVAQLTPLVTKVDYSPISTKYTGFYHRSPVFQISKNKVHILCWNDSKYAFHQDTKSISKAVKMITASVAYLKQYDNNKRIEKLNEDF